MNEATTMATLLSTLASVVTQILTWVGSVAETIVSTPILLLTTGFLVLGKLYSAEGKSTKIGENLEQTTPRKFINQFA